MGPGDVEGDEHRDVCERCGVDWTGAPGHPQSYCDEMAIRMDHSKLIEEREKLLLQVGQAKEIALKRNAELTDALNARDTAERLNDEMKGWIRKEGHNHTEEKGADLYFWDDCALCLLQKAEGKVWNEPKDALKRKCEQEGPAGLRCEREKGHDGPCMGDCSKAYPNQR